MMSKYWNNEGKYQAEFDKLSNELMPASGGAETLAGELVRSANRLYYDAFNNGFCNNTSGAVNFLNRHLRPASAELALALDYIEPKTNTGGYSSVGERTGAHLDTIVDSVVEFIQQNPQLAGQPSPCDMFDMQDSAYREPEPEYEEDYEEDEY